MSKKSLMSFVALLVMACSAGAAEKTVDVRRARALELYSAAPAAFIENAGQIADPTVRYVFCGSGANIFHTTKGPVFQLFQQEKPGQDSKNYRDEPAGCCGLDRYDKKDVFRRTHSFSMRFIGAKGLRPIGHRKQETKVNYFIGGDPIKWHTDVATYSEVVYPELYDGISLHTFGRKSHLKYEFHIAAGADYRQIVVTYKGAGDIKIDSNGALHINTPLGELVDGAPYIYQIINGQQVQITGRYRLIDENSYTFEISRRVDPTIELVIDPHLSWASYLGGNDYETAYGIAVDTNGNVLMTGCTYSSNFEGATDDNFNSYGNRANCDVFVTKVSSSGELLWITFLCGTDDDRGYGIAEGIDEQGPYVIVTGATASSGSIYGIPMVNAFQYDNAGGTTDAFVAKLYSSGGLAGHLSWSSYLGGTGEDVGYGVAVDLYGAVLLTGETNSTNFPVTPGKPYWEYTGQKDAFVAKVILNQQGNPILQWCQCRGDEYDDAGYAIAVDVMGSSLVVGATASPNFSTTNQLQGYSGGIDVLVAKLDTFGNIEGSVDAWGLLSYLGGSDDDEGYGIAVGQDSGGRYALLTGYTKSSDFPSSGGFDSSYCCYSDAFVTRINYANVNPDPMKPRVVWSSYLGGGLEDVGRSIAIASQGQVFPFESDDYAMVTGHTNSYNFPTPGGFDPNYNGGEDAFVTKVTSSGQLVWSSYLGGSGNDRGYGIAVDGQGSALLTGVTDSNDFPTQGEGDNEYNGGEDTFVAKISKDKMIGSGKLHGIVWNPNGVAIADANVIVQGQLAITDGQGQFSFDSDDANHPLVFDLFAGQTMVMVTKDSNYYPAAKIVRIDVNSTTLVNIQMTNKLDLGVPEVVEVHSKYCGPGNEPYYLHGPSLSEKFVATIDWGWAYDPNKGRKIVWETPRGECQEGCEDIILGGIEPRISHHGRCFDMGNDFGVGNNWLKVTAIAYDVNSQELSSVPKEVNSFEVIAPPSYIDANDANDPNVVKVIFTGNGFEYKILLPGFDLATWESNKVETGMPLFGGEMMNVGSRFEDKPKGSESKLVGRVNSDGTSDVFTEGSDSISKTEAHLFVPCAGVETPKLPSGLKIKVYATADFYFAWDHIANDWGPAGALNVGCLFNYESLPYYLPPVGGIPPYAKYAFDLDLGLRGELTVWTKDGPEWAVLFYFEPLCKGILGAGFADYLCVEGHLGGGFHGEVQLSPTLDWGDHYIVLVGGVEVIVGSVTIAGGQLRYCWWPNPGMHDMSIMSGFKVLDELEEGGDYYNSPGCSAALGYNEDIIEPNEFPYCTPEVVRIGDDMLAVWLQDNRGRTSSIHRTQLKSIRYNGTWSGKVSVDNDNTADMNPKLIALDNGDAVCIWQDAKGTLDDNCSNVETFNKNLEISVKRYFNHTRNWEHMMGMFGSDSLTNDDFLDRSPQLAVDESDGNNMLAVWISNQYGNTWGDNNAVNKIKWREYSNGWDGANSTIDADFEMILGTALAYKDGFATYVFCKDGDNDLNTPGDQKLWKMRYVKSTGEWTDAEGLNSDGNHTSPRLIYDLDGNLLLFWIRGDDIYMAKGNGNTIVSNDVSNAEVVVTPGASMGSKDFDLVMGDNGQIAIVWSDVSISSEYPKRLDPNHFDPERIDPCSFNPAYDNPNRIPRYVNPEYTDPNHIPFCHDIWISYYESNMNVWSMPRQLTWDDSVEQFISAAFDADGKLLCVYNKRQTEYQTIDYNESDGDLKYHPIHVENVPKPGRRSDFVYLHDDLKCDLAIEIEDVMVIPPNPMPGTEAKIYATIKNLGISPASSFTVVFSDCGVPFANVFVSQDYAEGDLDLDGDVDMMDVDIFIDHWLDRFCGPGNKWCKGCDIDNRDTVNFRDFSFLAENLYISEPSQILVGGGEIKVSANWQVPEINLSRTISVLVSPNDIQDDPNNNTVSFDVLNPDLIISEMHTYIAGPNSVVTVRVANKGVLPVYDPNNRISVSLMLDDPDSAPLQEKVIRCIEPMSYHDVQFILDVSRPCMVHAVVDPNNAVDEFNEDNNIRAVIIR